MPLRASLWIAVALAAIAAGLLFVVVGHPGQPPSGSAAEQVQLGGPFHMLDQTGKPVDQTLLNGKWSAIFFGYTYCPDVCPTTLQMLGTASQELGAKAKDFQVVFVTVDPARDTPKQLSDYLSNGVFPKGAIGLTGTPAQVAQIAQEYGVYFQKQGTGADYSVNHSAAIYIMDPKGHFAGVISASATPDQARASILQAMSGASANG